MTEIIDKKKSADGSTIDHKNFELQQISDISDKKDINGDKDPADSDPPGNTLNKSGGYINEGLKVRFSVSSCKHNNDENIKRNDFIEVSFNNRRKEIFTNPKNIKVNNYEYLVVQVENGLDLGTVTASGLIAYEKYIQLYGKDSKKRLMPALRVADDRDYEVFMKNCEEEKEVVKRTVELTERFDLDMKVTDAEWQYDRQRLTISFTAPQRIDFRLLVKELARTFRTRIELRQISTREEAKRIGGMGPCGRTLCCVGCGGDNCHVTLDHARVQQLSNNVAKLSGYCGRLKCCLLYEYPIYAEAFKKFPPINSKIKLPEGEARVVKADIFKDTLYVHIPKIGAYKSLTYEEIKELQEKKKIFPPPPDHHHHGHGHHHCNKHDYDNNPAELKALEGK